MKNRTTLASIAGYVFIVIGLILVFTIIGTYDDSDLKYLEESVMLTDEEEFYLAELEAEQAMIYVVAGASLIINVAIGILFITLGNIQVVLENTYHKNNEAE